MSETAADFYEKVKWVFLVFAKFWKQKFNGTITFRFEYGNLSLKYWTQEDHYALVSEKSVEEKSSCVSL